MRKIKLFISFLFVLFISIGQMWGAEGDVVYKLSGNIATGNNASTYGCYSNSSLSSSTNSSTISSASWVMTCGNASTSAPTGTWWGTNKNGASKMTLGQGSVAEAAAIASALSVNTTDTYYSAIIGRTTFSNIGKINISYSGTGNTAPSKFWVLSSSDDGATWTIVKSYTSTFPNSGTDISFSTIASARYAFVIYSSGYGTLRVPAFTFYEGTTGSGNTSVTLHPNGGIINADDWTPSNGNYTKESATGSFPEITHVGYNNVEWYKEANFATSSISSMPDPAVTADYYAKWTNPKQFSIIYKDKDNADFTGTHGENHPENHTYGTATALVEPTKTGYHFDGWFTTSACTGAAVTSLAATTYTDNITLYAKWTAERTAHFFVDGTEDEGKKIIVLDGSALGTLPTATSTDPEYTEFIGWTEAAEISAATSTCPTLISATTTISADKTYRAVFAKATTTTFDASDITNTPAVTGENLSWANATTGVKLHLSAGSRYTANTPNTFTVTQATSNYFQVTAISGVITKIVTEISEAGYVINSVTSGANLNTNSLTQTITSTTLKDIKAYATSSKQIRAKTIVVTNCSSFLTKFSNDPQISVSESSLNGFEAIATAGAGAVKSFKVSGVKLKGNISVTVSGNYEICQTIDGEYTNSLTLTKGGDNKVAETTIYVRLNAHAEAVVTEEGSISIASTNAETKSVTLAGSVAAKTLTGIAVKDACGVQKNYTLGQTVNMANLVIVATYNSGTEEIAYNNETADEFTFFPANGAEITGEHSNIRITYGTQFVDMPITKNCSVAWSVNGIVLTGDALNGVSQSVTYGNKIGKIPAAPTSADCDDSKVFVGWTATAISGETDTKPTDLFTAASGAQTLTANTTYYAVFASISGSSDLETEYTKFDNSYSDYCGVSNGLKTVGNAITKNNIWSGIAGTIKIKVYHVSNSTADVLTLSLIDKDGNVIDSEDLTTTKTGNGATGAGYSDYVSLVATPAVTGFKVALTTKNSNGTSVGKVTCSVPVATFNQYATTCCTKWTAPTLTYDYSDAIRVNDKVAATWGVGATHGTRRFESSDEGVLTVAANGEITAVGAGRATITAYWENDADGYCNNSVKSNEVVVTNSFNIIYKDKGDAAFSGTHGENHPTTHTYGTATTLVEPTKNYYTFSGWFIAPDCSGEAVTILDAGGYTEDITLYAKWTAIEYNITYNLDGGTNSANNPAKYTVENAEITFEDPSKTGHAFLGWYDAETEGHKVTSIVPAETHDAVELWAKWSVNSYAVDWSLGGGHVSASSPAYTVAGLIAYNTAITAPVVEREGYRFAGWKCNGVDVDFSAGVLMPAAAATYEAQWIKVWTVDFQNNGESIDGYPKTVDENAALGELPSGEELESCHATSTTFMGWSTAEIIVPGEKPADNTFATAETTVTGNLVYNAVWAKKDGSPETWEKVTAQSDIVDGGVYKMAGTDGETYKAAKAYDGTNNNVRVTDATVADNKLTSAVAVELTLGAVTIESNTYYTIYDGSYYWRATGTGRNNYLKGFSDIDTDGKSYWQISVSTGVSIVNKQQGTGNGQVNGIMQYNSSSSLFACYGSASQKAIELYKKNGGVVYSEYITKCSDEVVYDIELDESVTNGTIEADKYKALAGDKISLTATPATGYQLKKWEVMDDNTDLVDVENDQFDMPESNVLVSATFEKIPVSSISLSFTSIDVEKDEMPALPTISYLPTTILESQKGVNWTSDDETVAEAFEGSVMAYEVGQATLTATSTTNPSVTATLTVNVYEWNLVETSTYVVTPGTLANLTDAMSFTASEWDVKANYVRSDDATKTKQVTVSTWKAFIGETEIADGYQYQLSDNNKTLYIKVGDVVAASYELSITEVAKDLYWDDIHETDIPLQVGTYTIPTIENADEPSEFATNCKETHYVFKGWVTEANKAVPTDANLIPATGTKTADGTTYYAVWAEKKNVTEQKSATIDDFSNASTITMGYGDLFKNDVNIRYDAIKGGANNSPFLTTNKSLRLYKPGNGQTNGNKLTITALNGYTITKFTMTTSSTAKFYYVEGSSDFNTTANTPTSLTNLSCTEINLNHRTTDSRDITYMYVEYEKMVLVDVDYITECVERYELSFNNNGGSGESFESVKVKKDGTFTLPTPTTLNKDLHDFTGWNTNAAGEGVHYDAGATYTMGEEDVTLYAEWTPWTLESISLTTTDVKKAYDEGETFTSEGLVVKANYVDTKGEAKPAVVVEGWTTNMTGHVFTHEEDGTQTVTVTYGDKTATYDVTVTTYPNVTYYVNNEVYTSKASKDGKMVFPAVPTITEENNDFTYFVGWTKAEYTGIAAPVMAKMGDAVNDGDIFHAVFGKVEVESTKEKTLTIDKSALPQSGWGSYNWVTWSRDGMSGQIMAVYSTNYIQMNMDNRVEAMFNETMLPGDIKSVKITANKGTTQKWEIYASNVMFDQTATGGTKIGDTKTVSTDGDSWTVPTGDSYRYFMCKLTEKGASYIDKFEITYADPTYVAYSTKVGQIEKYTRENISGTFGTICLPKAVEAGMFEGATFFEGDYLLMNGSTPYKYYLSEVDHLEAGYPYVFVLNEGSTSITLYQSGEAKSARDRKGLVGTLDIILDWEAGNASNVLEGNYFIYDNEFRLCGAWCGLNANRAYLNIKNSDVERKYQEESAQVGGPKRVALTNRVAQTTTGFDGMIEDGINGTDVRKMLINNVIYIIRGGKMFDLNGRIVK